MEKDRAFALQAWNAQAQQANEQQRIGQRAYEFEASRMPSARDVFQTQVGQQEQQQRQQFAQQMQQSGFEQQQNMQQREWTHAAELRRQRLNGDLERLDADVAAGRIVPEEAAFARSNISEQVGYLEARREWWNREQQRKRQELEMQHTANETARVTAAENARNAALNPPPPRFEIGPNGERSWHNGREWELLPPPQLDEWGDPIAGSGRGRSGGSAGSSGSSGSSGGQSHGPDPVRIAQELDKRLALTLPEQGGFSPQERARLQTPEGRRQYIEAQVREQREIQQQIEFDTSPPRVHPRAAQDIRVLETGIDDLQRRINRGQTQPGGGPVNTRDLESLTTIRRRMANMIARYPSLDTAPQYVRDEHRRLTEMLMDIRQRYTNPNAPEQIQVMPQLAPSSSTSPFMPPTPR